MLNKNSLPISYQVDLNVPGFVKTDHQKFVQFLVNYYEYLDQNENINDYIRNVISFMDVDTTTEFLLNNFFEELRDMPWAVVADKRLLAQHIIDLYSTKGSLDSFRLLFRVLFNESIEVIYPSEKILRASDGKWFQESFFDVTFIDPGFEIKEIVFDNEYGSFRVSPTSVDVISEAVRRYHYDSRIRVFVKNDQKFYAYDANANKILIGVIRKSPNKLIVQNGGKFWQVGSIVTIPGSVDNTIARVTKVGPGGTITAIEILHYGIGHSENQITIVSPFPNKPSGSGVAVSSTLVSFSPLVYNHVIDIEDFTQGINETLTGYVVEIGDSSYFAQSYQAEDYNATPKIESVTDGGDDDSGIPVDDITIQDWLDSRATFVYSYDYMTKEKGFYTSDQSLISNSEIRLQDGFYYQLYSYVIQTSRNIEEYKQALSLIHPAGLKFFAELQKSFVYNAESDIGVTRTLSVDRVYLNDVIEPDDLHAFIMDKPLADVITMVDAAPVWLTKSLTEDFVTLSDQSFKAFNKTLTSNAIVSDVATHGFEKILDDVVDHSDSITIDSVKETVDFVDIEEALAIQSGKATEDSVSVSHADGVSLNTVIYMEELSDYFTDLYIVDETTLTIS